MTSRMESMESLEGMHVGDRSEGYSDRALHAAPMSPSSTSDMLLIAAGASVVASLALKLAGRDDQAIFVGQWPPTLVALACFVKLTEHHTH